MNAKDALTEFLAYLDSERGLARNSIDAYRADLEDFSTYCLAKKIEAPSITIKQLRQFMASLRRCGLSPRTISRRVSAIRQWYRFQFREGQISSNPAELLATGGRTQRLPQFLSEEEAFAFIQAPPTDSENGVRDRAMLELWYATGCRVSELANLQASNIDWDQSIAKFTGKGGRERIVPLSRDSIFWGRKYADVRHEWVRRSNLIETGSFFLTRMGSQFTRQGIWKIVKKYAKLAGLDRNVWPHMIRHSFATHVLKGGADLRVVQELLGHRSISTTEVYTHLDPENLKTMQLKYHPRS